MDDPPYQVIVKIPLVDAPRWLSHVEITREGDDVVIEVVKENGLSYGTGRLTATQFNDIADIATTLRG